MCTTNSIIYVFVFLYNYTSVCQKLVGLHIGLGSYNLSEYANRLKSSYAESIIHF